MIKCAVVGCGRASGTHIYSLLQRDDVELVALVDIKEDVAKQKVHKKTPD